MGVPAFYRWLSEKYPKVVQDVLVERVPMGSAGYDCTKANPNHIEFDNLYIDMNGIIHPCAHPEFGPQPSCEEEMYANVCNYVDHLFRVYRPRQLLYLAIDGVAPRAKMNQQRSRRFRAAQDARELAELEKQIKQQVYNDDDDDDKHDDNKTQGSGHAWDSNVITPGTPFMCALADYIRFYIRKRVSTDPAWQTIKVIFSDASIPGEGEHKIMNHIRLQRTSSMGYNPNTVHVLHGLDADLIMLALATHEVQFYISREEVSFGRRSDEIKQQRQMESGYLDQQKLYDDMVGDVAMQLIENQYKPLQLLNIATLREYLSIELEKCYSSNYIQSFTPSFERCIDDFVFLCFFVGNDFIPHLPSLDIRDGALDYLINVYQRILPTLSDYLTKSGGIVNLSNVDILLSEIGTIEDYVFTMKYDNEQQEKKRREEQIQQRKNRKKLEAPTFVMATTKTEQHGVRGRAAKVLEKATPQPQPIKHEEDSSNNNDIVPLRSTKRTRWGDHTNVIKPTHMRFKDTNDNGGNDEVKKSLEENAAVAQALKLAFQANNNDDTKGHKKPIKTEMEEEESIIKNGIDDDHDEKVNVKKDKSNGKKRNRNKMEDDDNEGNNNDNKSSNIGQVGDIGDEFDMDDDDDDDENDVTPIIEEIVKKDVRDPKLAAVVKEKIKDAQQQKLNQYAANVIDHVRLHEKGWKDRYYTDKCKADDVHHHGGREHMFRSYIMGLCWVMKYYYDGVPSWKWYYPFHYSPFASDLRNIERFEKDCKSFEVSKPFNPVEQLMAVLPADSRHAIPKASRWLMTDPESPIIDFYPTDVPVDPNGKAMPWLWVTLLPFIDEDRLLEALAPTMAQWTATEKLGNARGLDDGYLYVHRMKHPLSNKLSSILVQAKAKSGSAAAMTKTRVTDAVQYGITGLIRPPLSNEFYPPDEETVVLPLPSALNNDVISESIFAESIDPNVAICVAFTEPPKLSHKSILLPGARIPRPKLVTLEDRLIRRPKLNRFGGTIAHLGGGASGGNNKSHHSGYGSMNINQYERNLTNDNGRGHELYQTGTRAWGSLEPTPKRYQTGVVTSNIRQTGIVTTSHRRDVSQQQQPQQQRLDQHPYNQTPYNQHRQYQQQPNHPNTNQQRNNQWGQSPSQTYQRSHHQQQSPDQQYYPNQQQYPPAYQNSYQNQGQSRHTHNSSIPPPPPPPSRSAAPGNVGYSFRTNGPPPPPSSSSHHNNRQQQPRANPDVMNSLRAQLASTLNQNKNRNSNTRHS